MYREIDAMLCLIDVKKERDVCVGGWRRVRWEIELNRIE